MSGYKFDYEKKVWGGGIIRIDPRHFRASRLYWALSSLKKVKGGLPLKLLDVGCGMGDFAEAIHYYRKDFDIYGVDISKKAIDFAKKRGLGTKFIVSDVQNLPFKDGYFDAVTCFDLIEHVKNPLTALKEINRVLKSNGILHIFLPTENNIFTPEGLLIKLGWRGKEIYGGHPHRFSPKEGVGMIEKSGFNILKLRWGDHFIHQIAEIVHFSYLSIRGKNMPYTVEGFIFASPPTLKIRILTLVKNIIASLSFIETLSLSWFPALGMHLTCQKK